MVDIQILRYIVQINAVGSINRAAKMLYVSQSSLSRAIQTVENEIGVVLFDRSSKGVVATNEGKVFIDRISRILDELEEIQSLYFINNNAKAKEVSLLLAVQRYYPAVYAYMKFHDMYCKDKDYLNMVFREGNREEIFDLIQGDALSLGIVHYTDSEKDVFFSELNIRDFSYRVISDCPICAQMSIHHPLANEKEIILDQLRDYPRIAFLDEDFTGINYASDLMYFDRTALKKRIILQERGTHREIIANTNGYSIGTYYDLTNDTDEAVSVPTEIRCVPIIDIHERMKTVLIYKRNHFFTEIEEEYISLLVQVTSYHPESNQ